MRDDRPAGDMTAPAVWFAYSRKSSQGRVHPRQRLKNFKGGLQADAYAGDYVANAIMLRTLQKSFGTKPVG